MSVAEFRDVQFSYAPNGDVVIRSAAAEISTGSTILLVGANGSGKSTLVGLVCGWLEPTVGVVRVCGEDPSKRRKIPPERRAYVVPQHPDLSLLGRSVAEELELPLILGGVHRTRRLGQVACALRTFPDLCSVLNTNPRDLPLRFRWLLAFASGLATQAALLVVDEIPYGSLRTSDVRRIHVALSGRNALGLSNLVTGHSLRHMDASVDQVWLLHDGVVRAFARTRSLPATMQSDIPELLSDNVFRRLSVQSGLADWCLNEQDVREAVTSDAGQAGSERTC